VTAKLFPFPWCFDGPKAALFEASQCWIGLAYLLQFPSSDLGSVSHVGQIVSSGQESRLESAEVCTFHTFRIDVFIDWSFVTKDQKKH
jgi:hypothetical protein